MPAEGTRSSLSVIETAVADVDVKFDDWPVELVVEAPIVLLSVGRAERVVNSGAEADTALAGTIASVGWSIPVPPVEADPAKEFMTSFIERSVVEEAWAEVPDGPPVSSI